MTQEEKIELAKNNEHISTEEIKEDIFDTENEIITISREEKGFRIIGDRLSIMKADHRKNEIEDKKNFIEKLNFILEIRNNK